MQIGAAIATGNVALVLPPADAGELLAAIPPAAPVRIVRDLMSATFDAVLYEGDGLRDFTKSVAARDGPLIPIFLADDPLEWLLRERVVSTNTAAAGGNASLMTIG
jgi:RHH-type proline utilization regulon transcriptional repressor/proline dehydrogenase/delta 1-pyrroline-5-carboxylate dehydrogenase